MAAKKKSAPRKANTAPASAHPAAAIAYVAFRSLINMAIVCTSCAVTLGGLMTVLKLQIA